MIAALLKIRTPMPTAGHYFMDVLRYYGQEFRNDQMMVISGEYIMIPRDIPRVGELMVIDPFTMHTNAAASVSRFEAVRGVLNAAYKQIVGLEEAFEPGQKLRILETVLGKKSALEEDNK